MADETMTDAERMATMALLVAGWVAPTTGRGVDMERACELAANELATADTNPKVRDAVRAKLLPLARKLVAAVRSECMAEIAADIEADPHGAHAYGIWKQMRREQADG